MNNPTPLRECVLEEIALEGLDGITFEGFWRRLAIRMKLSMPLNEQFMENVWSFIKSQKCIQYYELPEEREHLKIFDRNDLIDPDTGMPIEPDECPYNNYRPNPVCKDGIRGSCEDFDTRIEIKISFLQEMTHEQVEDRWRRQLVMVASQELRESVLIPQTICLDTDLTLLQYCILERVGRSRYNGEATQGKWSLCDIVRDAVNFHYLRKRLAKYGLIERQVFYLVVGGFNLSGQLLHLPRFYTEYKPRHASIMEKIVEVLKQKPNYMAEYHKIKDLFDASTQMSMRRLMKNSFFQKLVSSDLVPYRTLYPDASAKQWKMKNKTTERTLHVLTLRDPDFELHIMHPLDDDDDGDDSDGLLGDTYEVLEIPLPVQFYEFIKASKEKGVSEAEIGVRFGQSKLSRRLILKNLVREKILSYFVNDRGRQKVRKYVALEYSTPKASKPDVPEYDEMESDNELEEESINLTLSDRSEDPDDKNQETETESIASTTESESTINPFKKESIQILDSEVQVEIAELEKTEFCMRSKRPPLDESRLTDKMKYRSILMLRAVRTNVMMDEPTKLYSLILRDEQRRGFKDIMCKKTFFRLLSRLCLQKKIRLWQIRLKYENKFRSMMYITDKGIDSNYSMMKSCVDQAKAKFVLSIHNEKNRKINAEQSAQKAQVAAQVKAFEAMPRVKITNKRVNYGNTPKFVRLRTFHEFLFYLIYDYKVDANEMETISQDDAIEYWKQNESFVVDYDELSDLPVIYTKNIEWKMFVPPLIPHQGFENGWCLLSDCIYRMPLSIFIKICNINYEIEGLDEFLSHPIKRHYLIHNLPLHLQQALFIRRRYIFSIDDILKRLCFMGLAQAGPHRLNSKDQSFYFLNRKGSLWNTVSSAPGYYYVSKQEYPVQHYEFRVGQDIFQYWDDMYKICMNTKLNRKTLRGHTPKYNKIWQTDKVSKYVKIIDPQTVEENDNGNIPGDHLGAAGLDSTFFSHLVRNWSFKSVRLKQRPQQHKTTNIPGIPVHANRFVRKHEAQAQKRGIMVKPLHKLMSNVRRRTVRKKVPTSVVKKKRARNIYDDVDRMALRQMNKLRVDWNQKEDSFLILCRVAYMYLSPTNRPIMPLTVVRDLLHWSCGSLNKTSQACKRRISYIMKQPTTQKKVLNSIVSYLGEIKENIMVNKRFGHDFVKKLRKVYTKEEEFQQAYNIHYVDLVHMLSLLYYNLTNNTEVLQMEIPNSLKEFREKFTEKPEIYNFNAIRYEQPQTKEDVEMMTIITLIHSTMCCSRDKTSWSIQLYEVYKDFQEKLLQQAMQKVRSDQLISQNKAISQSHLEKDQIRTLPLTANSYHLSITYQSLLLTKISYDLFDDSFVRLFDIAENSKIQQCQYSLLNSNTCFFLAELLEKKLIEVSIEIPNRILVLDPKKNLCTDQYPLSIYSRFKDIFNYIPKVDLMEIEKNYNSSKTLELADVPSTSKQMEETNYLTEQLGTLSDQNLIHFFCIVNSYGRSKNISELKLNADGQCSLDCFRSNENFTDKIMKSLLLQREIWSRLNADDQIIETLPNVVEINETNIVSIYIYLLKSMNKYLDNSALTQKEDFRRFLDVVEATLIEEEKQDDEAILANDDDINASCELKGEFKKIWQAGDHVNEKIHKFHDFLCVNACKLSLNSKEDGDETCLSLIEDSIEKRDLILKRIVDDAHWSINQRANADFDDKMAEHQFSPNEMDVAMNVFNLIETKRELGATASLLKQTYKDKNFLHKVLDILVEVKLVMRTGVCEYTYVHWAYVKQWLVNTYHLKRIDRECVQPNNITVMQISDSGSTPEELKRKCPMSETEDNNSKKPRLDDTQEITEKQLAPETPSEPQPSTSQALVENEDSIEGSSAVEKLPRRFAKKAIEREKEVPVEVTHPKKTTFTLKMAPWIRVNGSLNRRVLDKYLGTILLHCIENAGITMYKLCTRFYFLLPVHVRELVQYLEDMDCLKTIAIPKRKPITLFSTYDHIKTASTTQLDSFENIMIEPTTDAVTRMSVFIGDRKYKEDFI